ncbi:helix-turn-helix domain-containing protein [Butyricicoccus sp. OM04-18BH]|nr:helix-turn-helix domain-containing protein [Butyricicoccus sp. AM29-23AC]RHV42135.1 helix-turn-helix domain-containing protein [Butyricicoccus sp. OM04-18BH]
MTTGEKIAALRRDHKLSQEALGEKLGLSRQAVSKWEADQAVPTMDNLMELSRLFGVPVDTLLRPDAPFPAPPAEENSTDAPAASETPHKGVSLSRGKILAIGGAALLCVSLALNAVCLYQIAQLKGEVQALRVQAGNVNTVYYPGTDADTGDFAESSEHMTLDPENTEQLIVTFSAVPRVASDGETAKFLLRGGEQSWECEAEGDAGGGYRGSLTIPMVDEYSVYLVLTDRNGGTRNLLIASESDIENRFSIDVHAYWSSGGPTFSFGKNTFTGRISTYVDAHDALEDTSFTGRIILYQNGKEIAEQPLEYRSQGGEYGANIYDTEVRLGTFEGRMSDFTVTVEITDAYGRVFTASPD